MRNATHGVVNLQTYSRPHLLERCLKSIYSMINIEDYRKLFVLQLGDRRVENLVHKSKDAGTEIVEVDGGARTPLGNMNFNRWLALERAFDEYDCDWVLSIEEDVEVAPGTLLFIEEIYARFKDTPKFRGINLGSILSLEELVNSYSLQRFGVHGCGSVITRNTWKKIKKHQIDRTLKDFALDGAIEGIAKSGFMVTPNVTLYLDHGWDSGTHNKSNYNDLHFVLNRESWQTRINSTPAKFKEIPISIPWREDCVLYDKKDNFKYSLLAIKSRMYHTLPYQRLLKAKRHFKVLIGKLRIYLDNGNAE